MLPNHSQTAKQCRYPQDTPPLLRALWAPAWLCHYRGAWLLGLALLLSACGGGGESAGGGGTGHPIAGSYTDSGGNAYTITNTTWTLVPKDPNKSPEVYTVQSFDRANRTVIITTTHTRDPTIGSFLCPSDFFPSATNPVTCYHQHYWEVDKAADTLYLCLRHGLGYSALADVPLTSAYSVEFDSSGIPRGCVRPNTRWDVLKR